MSRGRKRRNRNRLKSASVAPFPVIDSLDNIGKALQDARNSHIRFKGRLEADSQIELHSSNARLRTDDLTSIFFPSVRRHTTAQDFVKKLLRALYRHRLVSVDYSDLDISRPQRHELPIIRCKISSKRTAKGAPFMASVTIRSFELAEAIVRASPISMGTTDMEVVFDKYQNVTLGGSKHRDEIGCPIFRIDPICFGQIRSDTFETFWSSCSDYDNFLATVNDKYRDTSPLRSYLGVDSVGRKLFLTTDSSVPARMSECDSGRNLPSAHFTKTHCKLRFEIPFASLFAIPRLERSSDTDTLRAVSIPIRWPPLIYRSNSSLNIFQGDDSYWDSASVNADRVQWARTVDPCEKMPFSRASAMRFNIHSSQIKHLFTELHRVGFSARRMLWTRTVRMCFQREAPNLQESYRLAASRDRVSFAIRYSVACVLTFPRVDDMSLDPPVWKALCHGVPEQTSLNILAFLYRYLNGSDYLNPYSRDDDEDTVTGRSHEEHGEMEPLLQLVNHFKNICGSGTDPIDISDSSDEDSTDEPIYIQSTDSEESNDSSSDDSVASDLLQKVNLDEISRKLRIDEPRWPVIRLDDDDDVDRSAEVHRRFTSLSKSKKQLAPIRRVLVTPTRVLPLPPELDLLNRVLRHFSDYRDRFIRVSFCDEDGDLVSHAGSNQDLMARIRDIVQNGIEIAGERFVFLAFSGSQLREHGTWMYNEEWDIYISQDKTPTADDIRTWMGEFSEIRVPGKYVVATKIFVIYLVFFLWCHILRI